jgi:hypothetical protein
LIETTNLYGGEIQLTFDSAKHQYRVVTKGRSYKVPSVTAVCGIIAKPALVPWAVNSTLEVCKGAIAPGTEYAESYLEAIWEAAKRANVQTKSDAATRGRERHTILESCLRQRDTGEGLSVGSSPATDWLLSIGACSEFEVERRIYSRRYRYSGTLDLVVSSNQGLVLIDWKTSKSIYPEFRLQTAAYVHAWEEEHPDQPISGRYLVRVPEDGPVEPHFFPRSTQRLDFKGFIGALNLFNQLKNIEKSSKKTSSGGI